MSKDRSSTPRRRVGSALVLTYLAVSLLTPGAAIVLHELGHFSAHAAFGYEQNRLSYGSVAVGAPPAGVDPELADGLSFAAGTGVSLLLLGLGFLSIVLVGPNPIGFSVILFECVRAALSFVVGIVGAGLGGALGGAFGELRYLAAGLGAPPAIGVALAWLELVVPFTALAFALRRYAPGMRVPAVIATFAGVMAGIALWLVVVGPRLLP
jgi:hypothetical protein